MQISGNGMGLVIRNTFKNEGVGSFWKGIVWAWGREGSYASIKLGAYAPVRDAIGAGGKDGTFAWKKTTTESEFLATRTLVTYRHSSFHRLSALLPQVHGRGHYWWCWIDHWKSI